MSQDRRSIEELDQRMKAAGMIPLSGLLCGQPIDAFIRHAGVVDLKSFEQWLSMRHVETQAARARMDLEKKEGDELYEWTLAHAAVFHEVMVNYRAALKGAAGKPRWIALEHRKPGVEDADGNGDVLWLRSGVECLGRVASGCPLDASHWRETDSKQRS
jgi:hypothetical protein